MAAKVPLGIRTHAQKVCSLYKRSLRSLENFYEARYVFRYQAVLMRDRFDKNAGVKDMRKAVELLNEGEKELFSLQHPMPRKFQYSPGGVAYDREVIAPDWLADYWHPLEKAQYPEYFKKREQRKKEFIAMYEKEFGKQEQEEKHH